ncbi:MAG: 6-carboxytetrahydropterin synthase QueD [Chitinispirillia bacterium]|nr:6-carboxytetrahydropterin synthase QueD [Chitinispirillia bacterium]MCL2241483.1 6-carboxytetrahydropterin synthase QueD [Chitinispirillia bacterium]
MYEITTESHFCAAHSLLNYEGPCENLHGHNWQVRATVRCENLDKSGVGIDFKALKRMLNGILDQFDHRHLNTILDESPSSECIARHIFYKLKESLGAGGVSVARVEVQETPGNCAAYYE